MRQKVEKYKIAFTLSHPVQYYSPLFRELTKQPRIDLMVYYYSDESIRGMKDEGGLGRLKWDIPLLEGYTYKFLKNYSPVPTIFKPPFGLINFGIMKEIFKNRYDAVIVHGYMYISDWFAMIAAWLSGTPIILKGEADLSSPRSLIKRIVKKIFFTLFFKRIGAFLYSYTRNRDYFKYYGVPDDKLFFSPCAVDNSFWQNQALKLKQRKMELKKNLNIPENHAIILYIGRLIPRKRPMDLLKAFEILYKKNINASLLFTGDGSEAQILKNYVLNNNIKNVIFTGFKNQSELAQFYTMGDVFVLPSEYDPSPKVINEAMNFGLPVITTDRVGTAPDLIKTGENGFVYPAGNVNVLADSLINVLNDKKLREEMGRRSLEIVSKWTYEENVRGILKALDFIHGETETGKNNYELYRKFYDGIDREKLYSCGRDETFYNELKKYLVKYNLIDKRVLEIGSGKGFYQDIVKDYTGMDIVPSLKRYYHKPYFAVEPGNPYPFPDDHFDVIFTRAVFEHIPDINFALKEMLRVLKRSGYIFFHMAWYVRSWAAEGYAVRPFSDFNLKGKLIKLSIPLRENIFFRALFVFPKRIIEIIEFIMDKNKFKEKLHYKKLKPNYEKFWCPDSDACNSVDPFSMILYFMANGCRVINYPSLLKALFVRTGTLIVQKL